MQNNQPYQQKFTDPSEVSFRSLATELGITDLDTPAIYDISDKGIEILSWDEESKKEVWRPMESFVVKQGVSEHYQLNTLHGTANHRVLLGDQYVALKDHPGAELVKQPIQVVDCEVDDTQNYISEGYVNHNTTTPGGKAVGYASSVRIKLSAGKPVLKTVDGVERSIGIAVKAKVFKNKVNIPHREAEFEIIFGKGIYENEQLFDVLRAWCDRHKSSGFCELNGKKISVEGTGAWKTFTISDTKTGVVEEEVKFYKTDFTEKILRNPKYAKEIQALYDAALIMKSVDDDHPSFVGVDMNSEVEVEALKDEQESKASIYSE